MAPRRRLSARRAAVTSVKVTTRPPLGNGTPTGSGNNLGYAFTGAAPGVLSMTATQTAGAGADDQQVASRRQIAHEAT